MQALAAALLETAVAWEQDGQTRGEVREIIGAVEETFLERLLLGFMERATGYRVLAEVADDRTYATWKRLVDERLKALGTGGLYLVSDRAKALIQLAEQGLECLSMPDCFHVLHEITQNSSLAMGRHLKQAHQELTKAKEAAARHQGCPSAHQDAPEATAVVAARQAEGQQWEEVQHTYRHHLETLSLTLHPFRIADSTPQTSAQVESQLTAAVEAIEALARDHHLPARPAAMTKVRKPVPALATLVDFWWHGVHQDLEPVLLSPRWRQGVHECLLPMVYWASQVARTRCHRRKATMQTAWQEAQAAFDQHTIPQRLAPHVLAAWHAWATDRVKVFPRASSAVEGRNGLLSQLHHNQRGLPKQRYKVWTILQNFDCRAADGTTPAARFFRRSCPDLFETVLAPIEGLPRSRQRKHAIALSP